VDIIAKTTTDQGPFAQILLQDMLILSVDMAPDREEGKRAMGLSYVTLQVTPDQAEILTLAAGSELRLVLRPYEDHERVTTSGVKNADLARMSRKSSTQKDEDPNAGPEPGTTISRRSRPCPPAPPDAGRAGPRAGAAQAYADRLQRPRTRASSSPSSTRRPQAAFRQRPEDRAPRRTRRGKPEQPKAEATVASGQVSEESSRKGFRGRRGLSPPGQARRLANLGSPSWTSASVTVENGARGEKEQRP